MLGLIFGEFERSDCFSGCEIPAEESRFVRANEGDRAIGRPEHLAEEPLGIVQTMEDLRAHIPHFQALLGFVEYQPFVVKREKSATIVRETASVPVALSLAYG